MGDLFLDGTWRPWRFLGSLPAAHFPSLQGRRQHNRGTGEEGFLELDSLLLQRCTLSLSLLTI